MTSSGRNQCQPVGHVELHGVQRAHSVLVERARQQFAILGESRVFHIPRVVRQIFRLLYCQIKSGCVFRYNLATLILANDTTLR